METMEIPQGTVEVDSQGSVAVVVFGFVPLEFNPTDAEWSAISLAQIRIASKISKDPKKTEIIHGQGRLVVVTFRF